ncbi:aminoacyl-tRNA hydrolase [Oceanispirochaeta crateris]|uniref:Peptidyl-tRNA hydrolase n=2 Tax=Oceanispirochaeta crateris TaxID=2518645 RepID=A0A5C1QMH8_9SPIO|nr:aminoacyl-tRNA hydrolase [Oceanispirochaeta crateris]
MKVKMKLLKKVPQNKSYSDLLIVGLGNPGLKYERTRHNVGFDLIELLSKQLNLFMRKPLFRNYLYGSLLRGQRRIHLVEPLTYMNRSGDILPGLVKKLSLSAEDIIIVTDNMDLLPGRVRMKPRGSSAGHNGLKSIIHTLGTGEFFRIYIGIGRPGKEESVIDHVLGVFSDSDRQLVDSALQRTASIIQSLVDQEMEQLLNEINSKKS